MIQGTLGIEPSSHSEGIQKEGLACPLPVEKVGVIISKAPSNSESSMRSILARR